MELDVTRVAIGVAALVIGGGSGMVGTNKVNETSNAVERQQMREIHKEELEECNDASEVRLAGARSISIELMENQRSECRFFVERCADLLTSCRN